MPEHQPRLRWGIIGAGRIAERFAAAIASCPSSELVAVGTRDAAVSRARDRFPEARVHDGYEALLDDSDVNVVYIATPHPFHAQWAIGAANAKKHVLCEKPLALSGAQASTMLEAARNNGTFVGEAFMYRFHPLTAKLLELLESGIVGEPLLVETSIGYKCERNAENRRLFDPDLAGGGIYDIGVYPVSMVRLIAATGTTHCCAEPVEVKGVAQSGSTGVDEWAAATLGFSNGVIAQVSCAISVQLSNVLRIACTGGLIETREFWFGGGLDRTEARVHISPVDGNPYSVEVANNGRGLYEFEVDATARAIAEGRQEFEAPGMSWGDTIGNMRTVEAWRSSAGLKEPNC